MKSLKLSIRDLNELYKIIPHKQKKLTLKEAQPFLKFLGRKKREWQDLSYRAGIRDGKAEQYAEDIREIRKAFRDNQT